MNKSILLNNGTRIPQIGFGTYQLPGNEVIEPLKSALALGYQMIDTATVYRNEQEIGDTLKELGNSKVYITSKLAPSDQGYEAALNAVQQSVKKLGRVNMYIIHWPGSKGLDPKSPLNKERRMESWRALEEAVQSGIVESIGVSNYTLAHMKELLAECKIMPAMLQIELHPLYYPKQLIQFCQEHNIAIEAYSSLGRGNLLSDEYKDKYPALKTAEQNSGRKLSQVLLRWQLDKNWIVIPKSSNPKRIKENCDLDFVLSQSDSESLDAISDTTQEKFCWDPETIV